MVDGHEIGVQNLIGIVSKCKKAKKSMACGGRVGILTKFILNLNKLDDQYLYK